MQRQHILKTATHNAPKYAVRNLNKINNIAEATAKAPSCLTLPLHTSPPPLGAIRRLDTRAFGVREQPPLQSYFDHCHGISISAEDLLIYFETDT